MLPPPPLPPPTEAGDVSVAVGAEAVILLAAPDSAEPAVIAAKPALASKPARTVFGSPPAAGSPKATTAACATAT